MMSLSPVRSSTRAHSYYMDKDNYYLKGEGQQFSQWWGRGAAKLGLSGEVDPVRFTELLEGRISKDMVVGLRKDGTMNHRPGFDMTFNAPKSVSILSLVGGDKHIGAAHEKAVDKALSEIEKLCAEARYYNDGVESYGNTNNLTIAKFMHDTSRSLDPHRHTHCVIMNFTERLDGMWRALASHNVILDSEVHGFRERVYQMQIYFSSIYRAELAKALVGMGYTIKRVGPHGMFEIVEVPDYVRQHFSKRTQEINEHMKQSKYNSAKARDFITQISREPKQAADRASLREYWQQEIKNLGVDLVNIIKDSETPKVAEESRVEPEPKSSGESRLAVLSAIEHLSDRHTSIGQSHLLETAMNFGIGKVDVKALNQAIAEFKEGGQLIPLGDYRFTTKFLTERETTLARQAKASLQGDYAVSFKQSRAISLSLAKNQFAKQVLNDAGRINIVRVSNVSSRDNIKALLDTAEAQGMTVRVLTSNRICAQTLNENIKRDSNNLWQWLVNQTKAQIGESVAGFNYRYRDEVNQPFSFMRRGKDVIVVDNANRLGLKDITDLLTFTDKTDAKVILLDNPRGQRNIGASSPLPILREAGITCFDGRERKQTDKKLPNTTINEIKWSDKGEAIAKDYVAQKLKSEGTQIVAGSQADIKALTLAIRKELQNAGVLARAEHRLRTIRPHYLSEPQARLAGSYKTTLFVRHYREGMGSEDWQVHQVIRDSNEVVLVNSRGTKQRVSAISIANNKDMRLFKRESIDIAIGDRLIATANDKKLNLVGGKLYQVTEYNRYGLKLAGGDKTIRISDGDLRGLPLEFDYVRTPAKLDKQADTTIAAFKSYALNQGVFNEIGDKTISDIVLYTDNAAKAEVKLKTLPEKLTVMQSIGQVTGVTLGLDRLLDENSVAALVAEVGEIADKLDSPIEKTEAQKAIDFAIARISENHAAFRHSDLVPLALSHVMGKVDIDELKQAIDQRQQDGSLVEGRFFSDGTRWTTKEALATENSIIDTLKRGKGTVSEILNTKVTSGLLSQSNLTPGQRDACHLILTTQDRFVGVQGHPGTGKSSMLTSVQDVLLELKDYAIGEKEIYALAPTHQVVAELRAKGIAAQTLDSFLVEMKYEGPDLHNKLLVVDESSMVSNNKFKALVDIVEKNDSRAAIIGDKGQIQSIEAGRLFALVMERGIIDFAYMTDILRQKTEAGLAAVKQTIDKQPGRAISTLASVAPSEHVARRSDLKIDDAKFFAELKTSVIEFNAEHAALENKDIELKVAEDYLSRTIDVRNNTAVIIHANETRERVNHYIRCGLQELGEIDSKEVSVNKLIGLDGEVSSRETVRHTQYYNIGQIVRVGGDYYRVHSIDTQYKTVILINDDGKKCAFMPEREAHKTNVEQYQQTEGTLSVGDKIKMTKTDKGRGLFANAEYQVTGISDDQQVQLSATSDLHDGKQALTLDMKDIKNAHWDYTYTMTGFGAQSITREFVIDLQESWRRNLTNLRDFLVGISRSIKHVTIYTDNKSEVISKLNKNHADKLAALDIAQGEKKGQEHKEKSNQTPDNQNKYRRLNAKVIQDALMNDAEYTYKQILGDPKSEGSGTMRYGGGLVVTTKGSSAGLWYSFIEDKGGTPIKLIQEQFNLSFREALERGAQIAGLTDLEASDMEALERKQSINAKQREAEQQRNLQQKINKAKFLWGKSQPLPGSLAETYLKNRGITEGLDRLKFRYFPAYKGVSPSLIMPLYNDKNEITAVQRVLLDQATGNKSQIVLDKSVEDKKKQIAISKISTGQVRGSVGVVQVGTSGTVILAEGPETAASIAMVRSDATVLATCSSGNLGNVTAVLKQLSPSKVIIAGDNDGENLAPRLKTEETAEKLRSELSVSVETKYPQDMSGKEKVDWNDVLKVSGVEVLVETFGGEFEPVKHSSEIKHDREVGEIP